MTLKKPEKPAPKVEKIRKPPVKKLTLPLAKRRPVVTLTARKASPPRPVHKPAQHQDVKPSAKVMPSPTARPVITPAGPLMSDNTLTAPMIHKRIMITRPPAGVATAEEVQSIGLEAPSHGDKDAKNEVGAPEIQASALRVSGRPAKPLMVKPVATGPTIAELLKAKQQTADKVTLKVAAKETQKGGKPTAPKPALAMNDVVKPAKAAPGGEKVIAPPSAHLRPQPTPRTDIAADDKSDVVPAPTAAAVDSGLNNLNQDLDTSDSKTETPPPKAELYRGRPVIIVHEPHPGRDFLVGLLVFILGLALILVGVNFLLDAGLIKTGYHIPHTNLLEP